jgi:hypothetical protein
MQYNVVDFISLLYIIVVDRLFSSTFKTEAENAFETFVTITLSDYTASHPIKHH